MTLIQGGTKDNVLPDSARAIVNYRLLPGDTSRGLLAHVTRAVADPRVKVRFADPARYSDVFEASPRLADRLRRPTPGSGRRSARPSPTPWSSPTSSPAGTDARRYEGL